MDGKIGARRGRFHNIFTQNTLWQIAAGFLWASRKLVTGGASVWRNEMGRISTWRRPRGERQPNLQAVKLAVPAFAEIDSETIPAACQETNPDPGVSRKTP